MRAREGTAAGGVYGDVSHHAGHLPLFVAALLAGALIAVAVPGLAPGDAPPSSASFTAVDFAWQVTGDQASSSVTIAKGGTVTFGYPSGRSRHNADFSGGPPPTSCTQTAGTQGGTPPPLPTLPTAAGWSGTCRFDTPGTYAFHCDLHPTLMYGVITVVDPSAPPPSTSTGTTTPPTTTRTTTGTTTTTPGGTTFTSTTPSGTPPPGGGSSPHPPAGLHLAVAHVQYGAVLRGTAAGLVPGARVGVAALASARALGARHTRRVRELRVGSKRVRANGAGVASFALRLSASARAALRRHHRLGVTLRVVVTPPGGRAVVRAILVVVRDRRPAPPPAYVY